MIYLPQKYHVALNAYPICLIHGLQKKYLPVQMLISKSLLRHFDLSNPNSHLPLNVVYNYIEVVKSKYGPELFDPVSLSPLRLKNLGITGQYIISTNRVLPTLQHEIKHHRLLSTNQDIRLEINKDKTLFRNNFSGFSRFGKTIMEVGWLLTVLHTLKGAEHEDWTPIRIFFGGEQSDYIRKIFHPFQSVVTYNNSWSGVLFKTTTLAKPHTKKSEDTITESQLPKPALTLSRKIDGMFENMYTANLPSLQVAAEFFDVSVSTLKRHLADEGTSYHQLMERWRFMKGVNLLTETDLKIKEISECLYYANPANFVRAFRRWSGTTPREFRSAV